jgi:hypothetical protein
LNKYRITGFGCKYDGRRMTRKRKHQGLFLIYGKYVQMKVIFMENRKAREEKTNWKELL